MITNRQFSVRVKTMSPRHILALLKTQQRQAMHTFNRFWPTYHATFSAVCSWTQLGQLAIHWPRRSCTALCEAAQPAVGPTETTGRVRAARATC
jgi:hypothetical protein